MASIISAGTTSGTALNMSGDTSGALQLATNGTTTAITISTAQNVGIGTASPTQKLQVAGNVFVSAGQYFMWDNAGAWSWQSDASTYLRAYYAGNEALRINSAGDLLVNQTAVVLTGVIQFTFDGQNEQGMCIKNSANSINGAAIRFIDYNNAYTGGGIYFSSSNSISYTTSSDYRLKENIVPMTGALAKVIALKPVTYKWKSDGSSSEGFIAHELQAVIPQAVIGTKDEIETYKDKDGNEQTRPKYQSIDTSFLVATLTAAIQELKAINDTQAVTITALTARIVALETV